jgi:hypothetical protein
VTRPISEPDWKLFSRLHPVARERFCERVLAEAGSVLAGTGTSAHERYVALFRLVRERDQELADAFDDFRRSTARMQLAILRSRGLLTDAEFAGFSPETAEAVRAYLGS